MKKPINEIKRMQRIAGLITESEYQESLMNESFDLNAAFEASPMSHSYNDVLDIIEDYEDEDILDNFKAEFPEGKDISREDYNNFAEEYMDDMSEVDYIKANWISISDPDIFVKAGLNDAEPNVKKIGKYVTVETDEVGDEYPDLNDQAISDYLKSVIDPEYDEDVDNFMNDGEGFDESRSHFFEDEDYDSIKDEEVEEWARQEMSNYLFSQPDEFPGKEMNESSLNEADKIPEKLIDKLDDVLVADFPVNYKLGKTYTLPRNGMGFQNEEEYQKMWKAIKKLGGKIKFMSPDNSLMFKKMKMKFAALENGDIAYSVEKP